jgi:2-oxoglutarate dehydrogenase E1 component
MSPKSLLRHKDAVSGLNELAGGRFQRLIGDPRDPDGVRRVLLCSGKVYFDLAEYRAAHGREDVAILRLEQLYPFPDAELSQALARYADGTPVVWVQEEPWNMGAWYYLRARLSSGTQAGASGPAVVGAASRALARLPFDCVSREASASPATGSAGAHRLEQEHLVRQAFGDA